MKKIIYIVSIIALSFTFNSCESETSILDVADDIGLFKGTIEDIEDFLGTDVYQAMLEAGLIINPGSTPENIEGTFLASPYCRIESDNSVNCTFLPWHVTFSNQNNTDLTVDYFGRQIDELGNIIFQESGSGKISGDSNGNFTVIVRAINNGTATETATAFSGDILSSGILNYQDIFISDVNAETLIGSVFFDEDGLAEKQ